MKKLSPSYDPQIFIDEHIDGHALLLLENDDIVDLKLPMGVKKKFIQALEVRKRKENQRTTKKHKEKERKEQKEKRRKEEKKEKRREETREDKEKNRKNVNKVETNSQN